MFLFVLGIGIVSGVVQEKNFEDLSFSLCDNKGCDDLEVSFDLESSPIYFEVSGSESRGAEVSGVVVGPTGDEINITGRSVKIEFDEVGSYRIEFEVEKESYFDYYNDIEFSVVEEKPLIYDEEGNVVRVDKGIDFSLLVLLGLVLAILIVGVLIFISYMKRNRTLKAEGKDKNL